MIIFAYDFPHKKTIDFIIHCVLRGFKISAIVGAPPAKLNIPKSKIRSKIRHENFYHPSELANAFEIPYKVMPHNSLELESYLKNLKPDLGLISGARILKSNIIDTFETGIINFHPGLIPEARGLDALSWSILNNIDLGVTSHLIDHKVDAGRILEVRKIPLFKDDTLFDLSERLYETQINMIDEAIEKAKSNDFIEIDFSKTKYNRKMPPELEGKIELYLPEFLNKKLK